nr:helical backbone metal receptor [uncultured Cetobacterium sp.]
MKKIVLGFYLMIAAVCYSKVERVVSGLPSITEIIIDMGEEKKIVGTDSYSAKLEEIDDDLSIMNTNNINEEKILELNPDLVLVSSHNLYKGKGSLELLKEFGIKVEVLNKIEKLDDIEKEIDKIGLLMEVKDKSDRLKEEYIKRLKVIKDKKENYTKKPRVYIEISSQPLYTTGAGTFINDVVTVAGGENVFSDKNGWISPSVEELLVKDPEIIFISQKNKEQFLENIKNRPELKDSSAVKNGKVYVLDEKIVRPSVRVIGGIENMSKIIEEYNQD